MSIWECWNEIRSIAILIRKISSGWSDKVLFSKMGLMKYDRLTEIAKKNLLKKIAKQIECQRKFERERNFPQFAR